MEHSAMSAHSTSGHSSGLSFLPSGNVLDAPDTVFLNEEYGNDEDVAAFETWLKLGLKFKHLKPNAPRSLVHFHTHKSHHDLPAEPVALLVTPVIFQRFLAERYPEVWPRGTPSSEIPREHWARLQAGFLRQHSHRRVRVGGNKTTLFRFLTMAGGVFQAHVLTNPRSIFGEIPASNPHIVGELSQNLAAPSRQQLPVSIS